METPARAATSLMVTRRVGLLRLLTAVVSTLVGYGFAMFRVRGTNLAFGPVLLAFMIPFQAVLTPLFLELHFLGC
jgi:multiple sugar transport system permease protein